MLALPPSDDENIEIQRVVNACRPNREAYATQSAKYARQMVSIAQSMKCPIDSILNLGCRTGEIAAVFESLLPGVRQIGVDIVEEFIDEAIESNFPGEFLVADFCSIPLENNSVDWIICDESLEHCLDVPRAISEACRVAKYGLFYIVPLEPETPEFRAANLSHHYFEPDPLKWLNLFLPHPEWSFYLACRSSGGWHLTFCFLKGHQPMRKVTS